MLKAVAVIPARFNSTRFPGKPLAILKEKPLIQHVYEHVASANLITAVFVATDDKSIFDTVARFGGKAVMTSPKHTCGTERIAEVAKNIDCDIIVNVQGDEPFIRPDMVDDVVRVLSDDPRAGMSTLAKKTIDEAEIFSPNVVKVVFDNEGFAMYFSRAPMPYYRKEWSVQHSTLSVKRQKTPNSRLGESPEATEGDQTPICYKHIGIYGYRREVLLRFASMEPDRLELIEQLEQLRALAAGIKIKVKETPYDTLGIDTVEDLRKAKEWWQRNYG